MNVITWIVLGLVSALIWSTWVIQPSRALLANLALGVLGALLGGLLLTVVNNRDVAQRIAGWPFVVSLIGSVVGAIGVLWVSRPLHLRSAP